MVSQYIIQGIFARNAQFVVRNVGRKQARWFYGVLGLILLAMAAFFFTHTA